MARLTSSPTPDFLNAVALELTDPPHVVGPVWLRVMLREQGGATASGEVTFTIDGERFRPPLMVLPSASGHARPDRVRGHRQQEPAWCYEDGVLCLDQPVTLSLGEHELIVSCDQHSHVGRVVIEEQDG